jgi:hypothetical protein
MTVSSSTAKAGPYAGAGLPGPFTVPFRFLSASHLQLIRTSTAGIDTELVLTTDYTVAGVGAASGSVTLTAPLASGERLTIVRDVPFTQLADYVNNDAFPAESHEDALDLLTMQTQQLKERVDSALTLPPTVTGASGELPSPEPNKLIGWDEAGNALQNMDATTLATIVAFGTSRADTFTGNGVQTQFALTANPGALANLDVAIGGVTQTPGVNYTFSGTTLTFTVAPPLGVGILARYFLALPQGVTDSAASTFLQAGAGAVTRTVQGKLRDEISAFDFLTPAQIADVEAGTMALDCTVGLQNWINAVSNSPGRRGYAPGGKYRFTRLYGYRDATLNPGFSASLQGRLILTGDGQLIDAEANQWPTAGFTGTVFVSTETTGDGFIISPASFDVDPYPSRGFALEYLSIVGGMTGYVLRNSQCPWAKMRNVTILQTNPAGNGVLWRSSWFTDWGNVYVTNTAVTGKTGVGVDFGASLFAGSFRFSNCAFERYRDGFVVNESAASVALVFDGVCTFQGNVRDGLQINGAIRSLVLDTPYFEFNGRSHIRCTLTAGSIQSLSIRGGFMLGGTDSASTMTGAIIHLRNVTTWSVDGLVVFRPWTDIVDVQWFTVNGTSGAIKNTTIDASDNTPAGLIYLARVDDQRAMPVFEANSLIGSAQVREFDASNYLLNSKQGNFGLEAFAFSGPVQRRTMALNGTTFLQSATAASVQVFNITGAGSFVALPGSPGEGRRIIIANQTVSTSSTLVRQPDATTNLVTLNAGQAAICIYDTVAARWAAIGPLAFTGL